MTIGTRSETIRLERTNPADAVENVRRAMETVGKLVEVDEAAGFVRGTTRYGLQKVRLKVRVSGDADGSVLDIEALGDDIWGKGARTAIKRFRAALGM